MFRQESVSKRWRAIAQFRWNWWHWCSPMSSNFGSSELLILVAKHCLTWRVIKGCVAKLEKREKTSIAREIIQPLQDFSDDEFNPFSDGSFLHFSIVGWGGSIASFPSEPDLQVSKYPAQASDYGYVVPRWICWWQKDVPIGSWSMYLFQLFLGVLWCLWISSRLKEAVPTYRTDTTLSESHLLETFSIVFSISQLLCCIVLEMGRLGGFALD